MLLNNEKKGNFGSFSQAGRISAKQFQMIVNKDKILNSKQFDHKKILNNFLKRNGYQNIFFDDNKKDRFFKQNSNDDDDLNDSKLNVLEDEINIFEIESKKLNSQEKKPKKSNKKKRKNFSAFHRTNNSNYKYHDKHMSDLKIINEKINKEKNNDIKKDLFSVAIPSRNFIWKKSPMPTEWKNMPKREILYTKKNDAKIYLNQENLLDHMAGKCFVDMNKQTVRGDFFGDDLRTYVQKKYENNFDNKNFLSQRSMSENFKNKNFFNDDNNKFSRNKNNLYRPLSMTTNFSSKTNNKKGKNLEYSKSKENILNSVNNQIDDDDDSSENDSFYKFKDVYQKQFKKIKFPNQNYIQLSNVKSAKSMSSKSSQISNISNKIQHSKTSKNFFRNKKNKKLEIKAPDFKTIISREYLTKLKEKNQNFVPFFLPNYNQVRERTIMMVDYKEKRKNAKTPNKYFKGIDPFYFYDYNKNFSKFNNHIEIHSPDFKKMVSRPIDDNPLPSYMKNLYNRNAIYSVNEKSLKMNNYENGKFLQNYSDFFPKKSFNKFINLNLLNSDFIINKQISEGIKNENDKKYNNDYLIKSMRFYRKNYDDLIKESELNKFDNITLKTIKKESILKQEELESFFKNYQQETFQKK